MAYVRDGEKDFLMDRQGKTYRLAYQTDKLTDEIEALDLRAMDLDSIPAAVFAHKPLKVLLLGRNKIKNLPSEIVQLTNLEVLNLNSNQLKQLPTQIGELKLLNILDLYGNNLTHLPAEIEKLKDLTSLNLERNELDSLPSQIGELKDLNILNLYGNKLTRLPKEIGQLKKLTNLYLGANLLDSLPQEIGVLENLTELYLWGNKLKNLPSEVGQLKKLTNLYLTGNQIANLPSQIGELKKLTELYLGGNNLKELPAEIGALKNLTILDLSDNDLTKLPSEIWELKNLTTLGLYKNQLSDLPLEIRALKKLTSLDLSGNDSLDWQQVNKVLTTMSQKVIFTIETKQAQEGVLWLMTDSKNIFKILETAKSSQIEELKKSISLDWRRNQLKELPAQIGELKNLTKFDLSDNQLTVLPSQFWELKKLTELYLGANQLKALSEEIGELKNLKILSLSRNYLSVAEINKSLTLLPQLEIIYLRDLGLTSLPDAVLGLKKLKTLVLKNNDEGKKTPNNFSEKEQEKIRKLLPNCEIQFSEKDNYQETFKNQEQAVKKDSTDYNKYFNLSFYALFVGKPQEAIQAAKKTLELSPEAVSVETNLALGYLLNNQYTEAEKIYLKWKGKNFPDNKDKRLCDEMFLADIADLEKSGITHPDFEKVKRLFGK